MDTGEMKQRSYILPFPVSAQAQGLSFTGSAFNVPLHSLNSQL